VTPCAQHPAHSCAGKGFQPVYALYRAVFLFLEYGHVSGKTVVVA